MPTALILLTALALRLAVAALSPLEYDEIWSLENFSGLSVGRIFTDLALPNNHPLNSLFVKLWTTAMPDATASVPQLIRIHSLVFGVLAVALVGVLARGLFNRRSAARWSMFFMALSAPAAVYSGLARGYSTQLCFLLLFACGLAWCGKLRRFVPGRFLPETALVLGAVGAVLAVPSAPVFLAAAAIAAAAYRRKLPERATTVALSLAASAVAGYLLYNLPALRKAQEWGRLLVSLEDWELFIGGTLADFVPYAAVPLIVIAAMADRRRSLLLFLGAALILGSAAVSRGGPARAYLPLCALVALACGDGARLLMRRADLRCGRSFKYAAVLALVLLGYYGYEQLEKKWAVTDYWGWFNAARLEPETTLAVYPATAGYPLCWNNRPELPKDYYRRLVCNAPGERTLLVFSAPGRINGMKADGSEVETELPFPGRPSTVGGRPAHFYRLVPLSALPAPGDPLLVVIPPVPEHNLWTILNHLAGNRVDFISLNPFFNYPLPGPGGTLRSRILFLSAPASGFDPAFVRAAGGRLYRLAPYFFSPEKK